MCPFVQHVFLEAGARRSWVESLEPLTTEAEGLPGEGLDPEAAGEEDLVHTVHRLPPPPLIGTLGGADVMSLIA